MIIVEYQYEYNSFQTTCKYTNLEYKWNKLVWHYRIKNYLFYYFKYSN